MKIKTIKNSILAVLGITTFIIIILGIIVVYNLIINNILEHSKETVRSNSKIFESIITQSEEDLEKFAILISKMEDVKEAYKKKTEEEKRKYLIKNFHIESLNTSDHLKLKVHFHLPPAKSLIRMWNGKGGDDLSSFRKTILKVYKTKKPLKAIEIGRAGFAIRGIAPILDDEGNYLGSVEAFYTLSDIVEDIYDSKMKDLNFKGNFIAAVKKDKYEKLAVFKNIKNKKQIGDWIFLDTFYKDTSNTYLQLEERFFKEKISELENKGESGELLINGHLIIYSFIKDFNGEIQGVYILTDNIKKKALQVIYEIFITFIFLMLVGGGIVFLIFNKFLTNKLDTPIKVVNDRLKKIGEGNLTVDIPELPLDFEHTSKTLIQMKKELSEIVFNIKEAVKKLTNTFSFVDSTVNTNKEKVKESVDMMKAISSNIESEFEKLTNIADFMTKVADNINKFSTFISNLTVEIESIGTQNEQMVTTLDETNKKAQDTAKVIDKLAKFSEENKEVLEKVVDIVKGIKESSNQIQNVVEIISEISKETSILAMNASIEASHAGQAGKGFMVIAEEIKELSATTENHMKEITDIVNKIIKNVASVTEGIDDLSKSFEKLVLESQTGKSNVEEIANEINNIAESSRNINNTLLEIIKNSKSLKTSLDSILLEIGELQKSIDELKKIGEKNTEELKDLVISSDALILGEDNVAKEVTKLKKVAENLSSLIDKFKIDKSESEKTDSGERIVKLDVKFDKIQWKKEYETGVQLIDEEHKQLVDSINKFIDSVNRGATKEDMEKILNFLSDYVVKHFSDEEIIQQKYNYPEYSTHKVVHKKFIEKTQNLVEQFKREGLSQEYVETFYREIGQWLINHILGMDTKIGKWIRENYKDEIVTSETIKSDSTITSKLDQFPDDGPLTWKKEYDTGIEIVDEQHKALVKTTNKLLNAIEQDAANEVIEEILNFLANYTVEHFSTEETYMQEYNYPGYEHHKKVHDEFVNKVKGYIEVFKKTGITDEFVDTLQREVVEWLIAHILGEDAKMGRFLRNNLK